ncbi:DeoR/GlpR family DNA-binding transcription regulator [Peribacillus loiseleuriae]|uniref:DeoR/GlpR family DNA-binding transcription regulator n=1 Tax=Peribacillus loiseleuriae TaxID=1679170 RepID=UPI000B22E584|nr:DeoR/GlpR family DNA-binding transcription regulator [Peribacillus loiseleuriae]
MITSKRHELLLQFIEKNKMVSIHDIVDLFTISSVTARRDVEFLEKNTGNVKKIRAGAVWQDSTSSNEGRENASTKYLNNRFIEQSGKQSHEKGMIAKKAATLIQNNESIMMDAGSTIFQLAKCLSPQLSATVFITAMNIAEELEHYEKITKIVLGGVFRSKATTMVSSMMEQLISSVYVDKLFIASTGLSFSHGFTCNDILEADVKKQLLKSAKEVFWLVDSSKIGSISSFQISDFDPTHTIVIDDRIHHEDLEKLKSRMKVIIAKEQE